MATTQGPRIKVKETLIACPACKGTIFADLTFALGKHSLRAATPGLSVQFEGTLIGARFEHDCTPGVTRSAATRGQDTAV